MGQPGARMAPKRCTQPGAGEDGRVEAKQSLQNLQGLKGIFVRGSGEEGYEKEKVLGRKRRRHG